jgi:hypothetical protein
VFILATSCALISILSVLALMAETEEDICILII